MFGSMFGFLQPAQANLPFGCSGSCELAVGGSGAPALNQALAILAGAIGTYAFIEQMKLQQRMLKLAEKSSDVADDFYDKSKSAYDTVHRPTWQRMNALYARYKTFFGKEDAFLSCAFALKEYCPEMRGEASRAVSVSNRNYARSHSAFSRWSGSRCLGGSPQTGHHAVAWSARQALAAAGAGSGAIRFEEDFKHVLDRWFWERWQDGAKFVLALGDRSVRAILAGAGNVSKGLDGVGNAVGTVQQAANGQASAIANAAQFWGNLASGGLNGFGQAVGAGYFNSTPSTSGWTTTISPAAPSPTYSGGYTGLK